MPVSMRHTLQFFLLPQRVQLNAHLYKIREEGGVKVRIGPTSQAEVHCGRAQMPGKWPHFRAILFSG